jgi:hypothetical protein
MQQVPNPEGNTAPSTIASNQESRWSRVPRVQPLRNQNDQRVPLYFDQTVPVWPLEEPNVRAAGAGGSRRELLRHHSHGVSKGARKWADINETEWLRNAREILRASGRESHAFNVSEILQSCSSTSAKWSGIEQDLFTCTAFVSMDFLVPAVSDFIVNKKSKLMTSNPFL